MILITGAATRIGAAIARKLTTKNARIILHFYQSGTEAGALVDELRAAGADITLWQQDLRSPTLKDAFKKLIRGTGPVDTLINNAAVFYPDQDKLGTITPDFWQNVMQVNAWAPLCLMQEFAAALPDGAKGNIINMLDQRVLNISHAFPVYTASKSALWAMTQNMARALAPNIRVNAIAPGHVLPSVGEDENKFQARQAKTPLGIGPTAEQIAETIQVILSTPSMTGACIPLDGGEHLISKYKV
jgi:NAD(P)-dependent dehydrogenase (short-subunit alcohol dehydrogenase family)